MAGANFGCYARELERQILDQRIADRSLELRGELLSADQPGAIQADVEIAEDVAHLQTARPFLQGVEMAGDIGAANHGADRGSDHDIRYDAMGKQRAHDADMGKAARRAAAERDADHRPADAAEADFFTIIRVVLISPGQNI